MSEDEFRARLDSFDKKLDRLDEKQDELRRELQTNSKEAHGKLYVRIEALENENAENRHVIAAMKEHMANDTSFEAGWQSKAYQMAQFVLTSCVGALLAILVTKYAG